MSEPVPSCPRCPELLERIAQLEEQVRALEARLGQNASNSSLPPSANPPSAPKPVVKKRTGQTTGGQPGHPGQSRLRLPPERVQHTIALLPHGKRTSNAWKTKELRQVPNVPPRPLAFDFQRPFAGITTQ